MTSFNYKARDSQGNLLSGAFESSNSKEASIQLTKMGLTPVSITPAGVKSASSLKIEEWLNVFSRVKKEEIVVFTRQLASIIEAGVPLVEGLDAVSEQIRNKKFCQAVLDVKKDIVGGLTFSEALDRHREVFSPLIVNMIKAGEKAGILSEVLDRISALMEREIETSGKIKGATRYPMIVMVALCLAFLAMNFIVIPKFAAFFGSLKAELPLPTRILMGINYFSSRYWYIVLGSLAAALYALKRYLSTSSGRYRFDKLMLAMPIFGPLFLKIYLSRFGRMLASMLGSGIPILDALAITSATIENKVVSSVVLNVREEVSHGKSLTEPMRASRIFPPIAVSMTSIGEKSGSLEKMLNKVADYLDREADYTIANLTSLLEPILIFAIGMLLLLFAMGIFLPMWSIMDAYKNF